MVGFVAANPTGGFKESMALKKSELYSSHWASCDELRGGMARRPPATLFDRVHRPCEVMVYP